MKKKKKRTKKKKKQFSKIICVLGIALVFYSLNLSAFLSWCGKDPISDVSIKMIGVFGTFVCSGYFALTGTRDVSKNKHKISLDDSEKDNTYDEECDSDFIMEDVAQDIESENNEENNVNTGLFEENMTDEGY